MLGGLTRLALARCDGVAGAGPALAALTALVDLSGTAASDADLAALARRRGALQQWQGQALGGG